MECGLLGLADRFRSEDLATTGTGKRRFSEAQSAGTLGSPIRRGEKWPARQSPAGPWPVQLRYHSGLTGEQYVNAEAWCAARLERCPELLVAIKTEHSTWSVRQVIASALDSGQLPDHLRLPPSTVHRLLSREGLMSKRTDEPLGVDRRRFAFKFAGELWMSDVMHGPKCCLPGEISWLCTNPPAGVG